MSDSTFEALSNIPGHISSFSASLKDASVIQSNGTSEVDRVAKVAYHLLTNGISIAKSTSSIQQDKLKCITVTFPSQYHAFTLSNDTIYGIERKTTSPQ
ncbi:hypothetical protein G6F43_003013 [Rhizopus delemar]|nr:hypothetical protein G6F43_003013 [Rhizopus delemar]